MRAIWKGAVSFGLVNVPVRLYSATEDRDVSFHQVHAEDGGRVRYRRVCQVCGEEVAYADIAKGYEMDGGDVVVLTDADLADLPLPTSKTVELLAFVPAEQLDPVAYAKSYYLEPDKAGVKPYALLRDALEDAGRVGLVKVAIRNRESLAVLRPRDDVLVLQTMVWPDEVRAAEFDSVADAGKATKAERDIARTLIDAMAEDYDPTQYHDAYREALEEVVQAKATGGEVRRPEEPEEAAPVVDLVAALKASVEAAKKARGDSGKAASSKESGKGKREKAAS
ncbi:MAG TPA: Ku protein [Pseudonocardiaceae bacterium]